MPSRFPAKRTTVDGILFDSKREAKRYGELKLLEMAKLIKHLTVQPDFPVQIQGKHFCTYTADFQYEERGVLVVEDVKSTGTAKDTAYRLRKKAAELFYGFTVTETGAK